MDDWEVRAVGRDCRAIDDGGDGVFVTGLWASIGRSAMVATKGRWGKMKVWKDIESRGVYL